MDKFKTQRQAVVRVISFRPLRQTQQRKNKHI